MSICDSGINDQLVDVDRDHSCGWSGETDALWDGCCRRTFWTCPNCGAEIEELDDDHTD